MDSNPIFEWADRLKELRDRKDELEAELKKVNADIYHTNEQLVLLMDAVKEQSFTRDGTTFYLATKVRANAVSGRKDELYEALRGEGYGNLVTEAVNPSTLSSFVKEQIAENENALPKWLEGLVSVTPETTVCVRKAR